MTAICCPAQAQCPDHQLSYAEAIAELQAARAELTQARILLNTIMLASDAPFPNGYFGADGEPVRQLYRRLQQIHIAAGHSVTRDPVYLLVGSSASFLRAMISENPFTYPREPNNAAHEAQLAEAVDA